MQTLGQNNKKNVTKTEKDYKDYTDLNKKPIKKTTRSLRKQKSHILKKEILRNNRIAAI